MKKSTVILADDHPVVIAGISGVIERDLNFEIAGSALSPSELVAQILANEPDIVVTDYSMPGDQQYGDGMRLVKYLIRHFPNVQIVILTMVSNTMIVSALYEAGVSAVISKSGEQEEILLALNALRQKRKYYTRSFQQEQINNPQAQFVGARISSLSPKEYEVLRAFVRGESVMQIAERLSRSVKTVSGQKVSAMRKLNVNSDQDLITFCMEVRLFQ